MDNPTLILKVMDDEQELHQHYMRIFSELNNIQLALYDYSYCSVIGNEGSMVDMLRAILVGIKNFFLNVAGMIADFFKKLFDNNLTISQAADIHISRVGQYDWNPALTMNVPLEKDLRDRLMIIRNVASNLTTAVKSARSIDEILPYCRGLTELGYRIDNGRFVGGEACPIQYDITLTGAGYTQDRLKTLWEEVLYLSADLRKLEDLKISIERNTTTAAREIDVLIAGNDMDEAASRREVLNTLAIRTELILMLINIVQKENSFIFYQLNSISNALETGSK